VAWVHKHDGFKELHGALKKAKIDYHAELFEHQPPPHQYLAAYQYSAKDRLAPRQVERWKAGLGINQTRFIYQTSVMRLDSVIRTLHAFDRLGFSYGYSPDGVHHADNQLSIHPALFLVSGFTPEYYRNHIRSLTEDERVELCNMCKIRAGSEQSPTPTFYEMSEGFQATHRTCTGLIQFAAMKGLPALGQITSRYHRHRDGDTVARVKLRRRTPFRGGQVCAIERML
jgi:hypothetical protein